jgi:CheY-like chemotaxis protein/two-component sensor histidine kinase
VRLVDDLLDVSRISRGKVDLRQVRLTLQSVLDNALESSRPAIEASNHRLVMQLPTEPVWIDGDLTRLAQVVSNLLNNAAKYTPAGGRIELYAQVEGSHAVIRVTDNGTGISADMLPRVFDLFAQVDHTLARAQGGLGIGLSLVKKLVELHGGDIRADSRGLGQGSRFTVRLPLAAHTAGNSTESAAPMARLAASDAPCRVLVCDDNVDGAESLALMLSLLGHEVRTVHDGPAALATVPHWRPDAVLLDIGLPGMSGYEVARQMRNDPCLQGILLVAVTGWGTQDDQRRSAAAGFDQHLTKPVEVTALESVLASRLARAGHPPADSGAAG